MGEGKGRRGVIAVLVGFVVILVYFFACAEPLSPELTAVPRWRVDLQPIASADATKGAAAAATKGAAISFHAGDRYGYFYEDGRVAFIADYPGGVAVSDAAYILPNGKSSDLKSPDGSKIAAMVSEFPFFSGLRLFSAEEDGTGVMSYDSEGKALWSYSFPSQISAFAAGDALVVGGTVDGWLEGVSSDGRQAFSFAPGGSRLSVILGLGVSRNGAWVAAVSGLDRQRLVVLGRGGTDYRVTSHRYLDSDYREPVRVIVMDDNEHVLYRRPDGIGVWSVDGSVDAVLPVKADDFDVAIDDTLGVAYLAARRSRKTEIAIFRRPATLLGRIGLPDSSEYVRFQGSTAYIGGRTWLARFDFVEE